MAYLTLSDLVAFYTEVTTSVVKGRTTDVICPDFCKAFDRVIHNILAMKSERDVFDRWAVGWIRN